jgi:hypothetical protein
MAVHPDSDGGRAGRSPFAGGLIPPAIARSFRLPGDFHHPSFSQTGQKATFARLLQPPVPAFYLYFLNGLMERD